jgi:hypothetical protein
MDKDARRQLHRPTPAVEQFSLHTFVILNVTEGGVGDLLYLPFHIGAKRRSTNANAGLLSHHTSPGRLRSQKKAEPPLRQELSRSSLRRITGEDVASFNRRPGARRGENLSRGSHRRMLNLRRLHRRPVGLQEGRDVLLEVWAVRRDRHQRGQSGKELAQRLHQHPVLIQVEA